MCVYLKKLYAFCGVRNMFMALLGLRTREILTHPFD